MTSALSEAALARLGKQIRVPAYDRKMLRAGIMHIGVGNFHRAHQAMYLHKLFNTQSDFEWAICGAGVKSYDANMRDKLASQNWLTTIVELEQNKIEAQICGSMIEFVEVNCDSVLSRMAQADIKIVSLTITEGGYFINQDNGEFDANHPEILADLNNPDSPKSVFGILVEALKRRKEADMGGFTIMSCDNIPHNGKVTKQAVLGVAQAIDAELGMWIESNVSFPNSMVDCIAPTINEQQKQQIYDRFGIRDNAPVLCESFRQWVLEDEFIAGRPALEKVGVQFVENVAPYELMKLRVLNGGHAALAYAAGLMGYDFVHNAMSNSLITRYLKKLMLTEVIPSLPVNEDIDPEAYFDVIQHRFANPEIKDTISRLYQDGQNRLPKFVLPTVFDNLEANLKVSGLSLVIALWCRLLKVSVQKNDDIELLDSGNQALFDAAFVASDKPVSFLGISSIFGDLSQHTGFVKEFSYWLHKIETRGVEQSLELYLKEVYMRC